MSSPTLSYPLFFGENARVALDRVDRGLEYYSIAKRFNQLRRESLCSLRGLKRRSLFEFAAVSI